MTTQYATASYQEIIDLHTESDKVSVVGIHTPCSDTPYHMLKGFWDQFRKFKYNGCSISLVPAAQLPPDPLSVSYEAGEPTIDPRDMLNPILFHGCHGDDMGAILNSLYSDDTGTLGQLVGARQADSVDLNEFETSSALGPLADIYEQLYYKALTDKTWLKAHPQRGFRKSGLHPMVYQLASTVQYAAGPTSVDITPRGFVHDDDDGDSHPVKSGQIGLLQSPTHHNLYGSRGYGRPVFTTTTGGYKYQMPVAASMAGFFTPKLQRLGWMDTRSVVGINTAVDGETSSSAPPSEQSLADLYRNVATTLTPVFTPKIFMGMILLPPAYKCEQYFRLVLNHSFSFAKFRGASMQYNTSGEIMDAYSVFNFNGEPESSKDVPDDKGDDEVDRNTDDL